MEFVHYFIPCISEKLERILPKRWQRTKNGHDPNIPTAPEGESMSP